MSAHKMRNYIRILESWSPEDDKPTVIFFDDDQSFFAARNCLDENTFDVFHEEDKIAMQFYDEASALNAINTLKENGLNIDDPESPQDHVYNLDSDFDMVKKMYDKLRK